MDHGEQSAMIHSATLMLVLSAIALDTGWYQPLASLLCYKHSGISSRLSSRRQSLPLR